MKKKRLEVILDIIKNNLVSTQDELIDLLRQNGFNVTQATISRDIKELRLIKTTDPSGVQKYVVMENGGGVSPKFNYIFSSSVISIVSAMNDVVIKCYSGMANAACAAIDSMNFEEIIGTLAGDDTILVIARSAEEAQKLVLKFNELK